MNKRTIVIFLSFYICILTTHEAYGSYPAAAGAGADATAGHSAQLLSQPKQIPSHITQLIGRTYYPADRYPDAIAEVPAKRALAQAAVKKYLDEGGDVNARDEGANRWTLLHYAAWNGNEVLATLLISRGANLEAQSTGGSPLLLALDADERGNRMPVVKVLIEAGADTNFITDKFKFIDHALGTLRQYSSRRLPSADYIAQHKRKTKEAINNALDPVTGMQGPHIQQAIGDFLGGPSNQEDQDFGLLKRVIIDSTGGPTKLIIKFIMSNLEEKPSLLKKKDESGHTLLSFAQYVQADAAQGMIMQMQKKRLGHIKACEAFKQKELTKEQAAQKETLKQAALAGDAQALAKINDAQILDARFDGNKTALILAAEKGHEKVVDALLTKKANLACLDDTFKSALWYATQYGHKAIVERILKEIPLQGASPVLRREVTQAHELAAVKEKEVVINKELYKQIKELLAPYVAHAQGQAAAK